MFSNVDTFQGEKLSELKQRLDLLERKPKVIAISEVKPKNFRFERSISEYNIAGYEMITLNLNKEDNGRGMIVYIDSSIKYSPISIDTEFLECICVEFQLKNNDKLLLASVYRSPSSSDENNSNFYELLKKLSRSKYSHLLIFGDMNYPFIDWVSTSSEKGPGDVNYEFLETIRDCYLHQHILEPTRGRGEAKPTTIDLLFSNEEGMVDNIEIQPPLGKSDHSVITFDFRGYVENQNKNKVRYKYDKADYKEMHKILDIDWKKLLSDKCIDEQWSLFTSRLSEAVEQCEMNKVSVH
jgi:hypothetical protein